MVESGVCSLGRTNEARGCSSWRSTSMCIWARLLHLWPPVPQQVSTFLQPVFPASCSISRSGNAGSLAAASSLAAPSSGTAGIGLDRSGIAGGFTTPSSGAAGSGPVRRGLITSGLITAASSRGAASSAAASPPEQWRWWERLCQEQPHQERPVVQ
ncbi:uncharacterized protein LOC123946621 isoform X6 [Meles meles]|uniref:uncharacterized protein LOC123946621 isoform X6 n=1 Tax=Meles meles TaxID=9662 RepID=UPI001E6A0FD5|nr:uncharacterized protein LOC123946621 isoform X6 [Meles meles]